MRDDIGSLADATGLRFYCKSCPAGVNAVEVLLNRLLIPAWYYMDVASIALTVHEYLLSFEAECRVIWGRKITLPSILFLINRYLLWLYALSSVMWNFIDWETDEGCRAAGYLDTIVIVLLVVNGGVFAAVRIHVVNGRRWFWTCSTLVLSCISAPYNTASIFVARLQSFKGVAAPVAHGCFEGNDNLSHRSWNMAAIALQASGCLCGLIITGITWYRAGEIVLLGRKAQTKTSFASLIVRSGTMYFVMELVFSIVQVWLFFSRAASIATLSITVESILTSRFILNLRLLDSPDDALEMSSINIPGLPTLPTISQSPAQSGRFSALDFGNIGAPLDFDEEPEDADEQLRDGDIRVEHR